jgi:predicted aspartyl protease
MMDNQKIPVPALSRSSSIAATLNSASGLSASVARTRISMSGILACMFAGLLLSISGCAQHKEVSPTHPCLVVTKAKLPITLHERRIIVSTSLNGRPVRMMVDTGANISAIAPHIAESIGGAYNRDRLVHITGMGGRSDAQHPYKVKSIQIGPLHWFDFEVMVVDVARVEKRANPEAVAGIIGADLLRRYDIEFDFQHGEMKFHQSPNCKGDFVPWAKPYEVLRSPPNRRRFFIIPVELNGHTLRALVDTGASTTLVDRTAAITAGADPAELQGAKKITAIGIGGVEVSARSYRFDSLNIADRKFRYHSLDVSDAPLPSGIDMLLGMDFWGQHRMWLSYQTDQVFMQPNFRIPDVIFPPPQ